MGVVGADADGEGATGVAPGATLAGLRIGYGFSGNSMQYANALRDGARFDVVNSSWGYSTRFADDFAKSSFTASHGALEYGVSTGRDGLGTIYTFAAGNARTSGDDVNHHNHQNAIETIAVAATNAAGKVASFSTPGAAILVSAPGVDVVTADLEGSAGYRSGDTAAVDGTSFAAPAVAGVAALMLEANPALGWRDVMEIMALSATKTDPGNASWRENAATGVNGGGFWTSRDYGFGLIDARAAVRLAESWNAQSTSANMLSQATAVSPDAAIPDLGAVTIDLDVDADLSVEQIELRVRLDHSAQGNLIVTLISPSGTESVLIDQPALRPGASGRGDSRDDLRFTLTSNEFWGEDAEGRWTVRVADAHGGDVGTVETLELTVHGGPATDDNRYIYTDAFAQIGADAARRVLDDKAGIDTINAAALSSAVQIDLEAGMTIAGHQVAFAAGTVIENAHGGDSNDTILGSAGDNRLFGARGDDSLSGRGGDDWLEGGAGSDVIDGGAGTDTAAFAGLRSLYDIVVTSAEVVVTFAEGVLAEVDRLIDIEWLAFDDMLLSRADLGAPPVAERPVNTSPVARDDGPFEATSGQEVAVALSELLANDTDPEGDALTVTEIVSVTGGVATLGADALSFTAATPGEASVVYRVSDGRGGDDVATVTFAVTDPALPVDDASSFVGLNLWYDLAQTAPGEAKRLTDLSGRGADAKASGSTAAAEATPDGLRFDGDDVYRIADTRGLNTGGPFDGKTLTFTIETAADLAPRQVLYEQGGALRGLSVYVEDGLLVMAGWNLRGSQWGVLSVSDTVASETRMTVSLVFDAASGDITGYRNGTAFGVAAGATTLHTHSDDIGLGGVRGQMLDAEGRSAGSGGDRWDGAIFEVAAYERALDAAEISALHGALGAKWDVANTPRANTAPVAADDGPFDAVAGTEATVPLAILLANDTDADGEELLVQDIVSVTGGTAWTDSDSLIFTAEDPGEATVVYRVTDGAGGTDEAGATFAAAAAPPSGDTLTIPGPDDPATVLINDAVIDLGDKAKTYIFSAAMENFSGAVSLLNKHSDPGKRGIQDAANGSLLYFADASGGAAQAEFEAMYALALAGDAGLSVAQVSPDTLRFELEGAQATDVLYFQGAFVDDFLA